MTKPVSENRTGRLENDKDFGIAFRKLVQDFNNLVREFNAGTGEPVSFSEITELPDDLEGYGIKNAAHLHHRHLASDITGLVTGSGAPGAPGPPGVAGATGGRGRTGLGVPGIDGLPGMDSLIPGPRGPSGGPPGPAGAGGADGKDGRAGAPNFDTPQALEPLIIPGRRGVKGNTGTAGRAGRVGIPGRDGSTIEPFVLIKTAGYKPVRKPAVIVTASLADLANEAGTVIVAKTFGIIKVQADRACRFRLYSTVAFAAADLARAIGTDPVGEHGCVAEFVFTAAATIVASPMALGANAEATTTKLVAYNVQNRSGGASPVTVTITFVPLEV